MKNKIMKTFEEHSSDWQEVVEKDYEILSFKWIKRGNGIEPIYTLKNGKYCFDHNIESANRYELSQMLKDSHINYKIHSVKRLSDGEIFTIGDKLKGASNTVISLDMITLYEDRILLQENHITWILTVDLDKAEKVK